MNRILITGLATLFLTSCEKPVHTTGQGPVAGWNSYGGNPGGERYSVATDINPENVGGLAVAWTYRTGEDFSCKGCDDKAFEATPVLVDGRLIFSTQSNRIIALNPETGAELWKYDPQLDASHGYSEYTSRGVAVSKGRVYHGTRDGNLIALDATTGKLCPDFGVNGIVDLKVGVGRVRSGQYQVTSPPAILRDLVIVGSAIGDNGGVELERGVVRAFNANTGALVWSFDPIPRDPADPARATWGGDGADITGGANAWSILSVDVERDLVFIPTTSPSPDYWGGRRLGANQLADSVVALRGSTGKVVWSFQTIHHDLWDYDLPAQPVLITVKRDGVSVPAVVQATKMGFLYVLHRETGKPLFPVEERPVPKSDIAGEESWPTQMFPILPPPLVGTSLKPEDAWGLTPVDRKACRDIIASMRSEGIFTPPSERGTIIYPSHAGGTNWGSLAYDQSRGLAIVNANQVALAVRLVKREQFKSAPKFEVKDPETTDMKGTPYIMQRGLVASPLGVPCNAPPWGILAAVDLNSGQIRWKATLGTISKLIPVPLPIEWGTPNMGGPIVTASGLIFIGAAMDDKLRAFRLETGEELWNADLPAGGQATPMTYKLSPSGKQYVVIAAGGHGKLGTTLGDSVVAYALP